MSNGDTLRPYERYWVKVYVTELLCADAAFDLPAYLTHRLRRALQAGAEERGYSLLHDYTPPMRQIMPEQMNWYEREHCAEMQQRKYVMIGTVFPKRLADIHRACAIIDNIQHNRNGHDPLLDFLGIMDWVSELHRLVHSDEPTNVHGMIHNARPGQYFGKIEWRNPR